MFRLPNAFFVAFILILSQEAMGQHRFIENGGQWNSKVLFRTDVPGGKFYIEQDRLTIDLYDVATTDAVFAAHGAISTPIPIPPTLKCHAYQVAFEGANQSASIGGRKKQNTVYNFFLGKDPTKWASQLSAYEEVVYNQIYQGIDLKIYTQGALKYDFIVSPYADPAQIVLDYLGTTPRMNRKGQLEIKTSVGDIIESKPFAYQVENGTIKPVECRYSIEKNKVRFILGEYNRNLPLVIDPELIFSTYSGSFSDNFGYTATSDIEGHLYSGSTVFGTLYPTTIGAYQLNWAGGTGAGSLVGTDMGITKFSLDGTDLIYSTYLGGSADELPHSLVCDSTGALYILGTTGSDDYPVSENAFQPNFQGGTPTLLGGVGINYSNGSDIVVSKLSPTGSELPGSTYIGGTENDGTNTNTSLKFNYADEVRGEIEVDRDGNILIGSCTFSSNFPTTPGAYQTVKSAGQDGVIFKLDPDMTSLLASTFFGGSGGDAVYSINAVEDGTIMAGGGTTSTDLAISPDAYQPTYGGGSADGYLATLNEDLTSVQASTYFGSSAYDQVYFVERDGEGNAHLYGQTTATGSTFIFNAPFNNPNSGMLLAKLTPDLESLTWSTVFGSGTNVPNLSPTAFSVDICNRIYLSGWGGIVNSQGSTTGLPVTSDALKSNTDGSDFYFMVLSGDADELTFATFFGGNSSAEHVDGGTSRFDRAGKIYQAVCAGCGSNDDFPIAPSDAWSPTNNSSNCNLGVAKIDFDLPLVVAGFSAQSVCLPDAVVFENNTQTFSGGEPSFFWEFGDGNTSNLESPTHTYSSPGTYLVELSVTDLQTCNITDEAAITIEVFPEITLIVPDTISSCTENTFTITSDSEGTADSFIWASDPDFTELLQSGPQDSVLTYLASETTTIYIKVVSGPCEKIAEILVVPPPQLLLSIEDTLLCSVQEIQVSAILSAGSEIQNYLWNPVDNILSGQGTNTVTIDANAPISLSVNGSTIFGCEVTAAAQIDVFPIQLEVPSDTLVCSDDALTLVANSNGTAQEFTWSSNPNFTDQLNAPGDSAITVIPDSFGYYYIMVDNNGCSLIDSVGVSLLSAGTSVNADQFICAGDTTVLIVSNDFPGSPLTHSWGPEEYIVSGQGTAVITVVVTEPTTFTVISSTPEGCVVENSTTVFTSLLGGINIEASADPENITVGGSSTISASPVDENYIYQWVPATFLQNPSAAQTTSTPDQTITYVLTITEPNVNGLCSRTDSVTISVFEAICGSPNIYVPNAFTPNGDNENDVLFVRGGGITDLKFSVFDRWGNKVFETENQNTGWDGTYKGNLAEPAVFVYYLEAICGDGQTYFEKGNVTLIR